MRRRQAFALAAACLPAPWRVAQAAGSFSVFPTQLRFDAGSSTGSLRLNNLGASLAVFQVDPRVWTAQGSDESASDLIINPTVVSVAPGRQQTLRVGLVRQAPATVERTYRLYLQQVEGERAPTGSGTELLLRIGVPVFVAPFTRETRPLQLQARREGEQLQVRVDNPSNHHVRLLGVRWRSADGPWIEIDTRPVYVLALASVGFATPLPAAARSGELELRHDSGTLSLAWGSAG